LESVTPLTNGSTRTPIAEHENEKNKKEPINEVISLLEEQKLGTSKIENIKPEYCIRNCYYFFYVMNTNE